MPTVKNLDYVSRPVMWTALVGSIVLMVLAMYGWFSLGQEIRAKVTEFQLATLIFFVLVMVAIMLSIGYSRMWANDDGVTVRNMFRVRTFALSDIVGVRFREGDPWAFLLLRDEGAEEPKRHAILAIQSLERGEATTKVLRLRQWLDLRLNPGTGADPKDPDEPDTSDENREDHGLPDPHEE
ncbi:MAG: PH domain-containing protein [Propionibacteriaceae bacterium]|nr:PH domain-containing protein [Propionibacteriaceae bacterium]